MSLEHLAEMQYRLTVERNKLKEERALELSMCDLYEYYGYDADRRNEAVKALADFSALVPIKDENCYGVIMRGIIEEPSDVRDDYIGFDEALYNVGCQHCQKARTLKREIGRIGQKLGQIRGQITRYGKRLSEQDK